MPNMSLKRNEMPTQPACERNKNFKEVALGYTDEMAVNTSLVLVDVLLTFIFLILLPKWLKVNLKKLIKLLLNLVHYLLYVDVFAHKKLNVSKNVFVA